MRWLEQSAGWSERPAIFDARASRWLTYGQLRNAVEEMAEELGSGQKRLVFLACRNDIATVVAYLACLEAGHAAALLAGDLNEAFWEELIQRYAPDLVLGRGAGSGAEGESYAPFAPRRFEGVGLRRVRSRERELFQDLALLLPTSGSTGSPKFVRLTAANLLSNASAISQRLEIGPDERAVGSLPLCYSYGLSVLNTHLQTGASIALTEEALTTDAFWSMIREQGCTSMAGVPYTYQILKRLDLDVLAVPSLRALTQAGGRLDPQLAVDFHHLMERRQGRFFVMYGQTEATARMTILPHESIAEKPESVGTAIPGGRISTASPNAAGEGEVVYSGDNVMLGYAESEADLALGDVAQGQLNTGDLGRLDEAGFLFITGRLKRISKIFGYRINLDDVEALLRPDGQAAVVGTDSRIVVFCEVNGALDQGRRRSSLASSLGIHQSVFDFRTVPAIPLLTNGKVDYQALREML